MVRKITDIIVNINSFCDMNVTVNTILKCYHKQALNKKLELMRKVIKYFGQNYLVMKYLALWSSEEISKTLRPPFLHN